MAGALVWKLGIAIIAGLVAGWLFRHFLHWPIAFNKSDTTRFFRKGASNVKLYSPPVLRCTLLVTLAAVVFTQSTVLQWQARENSAKDKLDNLFEAGKITRADLKLEKAAIDAGSLITVRDYQLLKLGAIAAAFTVWVSFIDSSWTKAKDDKRREDENQKRLEGLPG